MTFVPFFKLRVIICVFLLKKLEKYEFLGIFIVYIWQILLDIFLDFKAHVIVQICGVCILKSTESKFDIQRYCFSEISQSTNTTGI